MIARFMGSYAASITRSVRGRDWLLSWKVEPQEGHV